MGRISKNVLCDCYLSFLKTTHFHVAITVNLVAGSSECSPRFSRHPRCRRRFLVAVTVLPLFQLLTTFFNVQVATRFLSVCPPIYWYAAHLMKSSVKEISIGRIIWTYYLSFLGLGSLLFINFYPFTWYILRHYGYNSSASTDCLWPRFSEAGSASAFSFDSHMKGVACRNQGSLFYCRWSKLKLLSLVQYFESRSEISYSRYKMYNPLIIYFFIYLYFWFNMYYRQNFKDCIL